MLQEEKVYYILIFQYYIMQIIFDEKEYILPLVTGSNPKFTFDEIITQEMKYEEMEDAKIQSN